MIDLRTTPETLTRLAQLAEAKKVAYEAITHIAIEHETFTFIPALLSDLEAMKREVERLNAKLESQAKYIEENFQHQ